jgi:hypothetical protein
MDTWTPETPFLETTSFVPETVAESPPQPTSEYLTPWNSSETPFLRDEYETDGIRGAELESLTELFGELRDETFEHSVYQLAARAADYLGDRYQGEYGEMESEAAAAERQLETFFAPLTEAGQSLFERLADGIGRHDLTTYGESELESLLSQYAPTYENLEPEFEQFVGKLFKKAKSLVSGAVNLAKKGISTLAKFGLGPLLRRLGKLVLPLVKRIIRFAMNRIPAGLRPIAQRLAAKLFGAEVSTEAELPGEMPNSVSAEVIQQEFDLQLLSMLTTEGEQEAEQEVFEYEQEQESAPSSEAMEAAKVQFVQQFSQLQKGQDATPAVQQFVPAALMALRPLLRPVLNVLGRPKIVDFLGGLIGKLIQRWVGQQEARALGSALADTGLSLLGFETPEAESPLSGAEMVAEALEHTIVQTAQLPEHIFENDVMLEASVREAFEAAAAAYFPDVVIRPELRETAQAPGVWAPRPRKRKRKYYRKYTRVLDVEITPQVASSIKVFGGATLAEFFRDVLLLPPGKNVKAKAHLYELTLGARLADIARLERHVPGLGTYHWYAWSQLQPLTPEAAIALFREPGLARPVDAAYLAGPYLTGIGQRFYYLQIPGLARPSPPPPQRRSDVPRPVEQPTPQVACRNNVSLTVNLGGARIVVRFQFSEQTAQEIAQALRRRDFAGAWRIAKNLDGMLRDAVLNRRVNLVGFEIQNYSAATGEQLQLPAAAGGGIVASLVTKILDKIIGKIIDLMWDGIANFFRNTAQEFIRATEDPADGVVVYCAFVNIPGLSQIRNLRRGGLLGGLLPSLDMSIPRPSISVHAGCRR